MEKIVIYKCEDCPKEEEIVWSIEDYKERGEPVCPNCDKNMEFTRYEDHTKQN